jgi:hypothetical protein
MIAAAGIDMNTLGPIINLGAVGVMLVVLGFWYVKKDKKYEQRIDERIAAETQFRKEQAEQQDKYRAAMEKFGQTLDALLKVMPKGGP